MKSMSVLIFLGVLSVFAYPVIASDSKECMECHDDKLRVEDGHGGVAAECTFCHMTHDDDIGNPGMLKTKKVTDTCLECHDDLPYKLELGHPINNHPIEGGKDPIHPEKRYSCASCHNPHGSAQKYMFRYPYKQQGYGNEFLCVTCHRDLDRRVPKPPIPPWD